jgi:hypothetical protein
MTSITLQTGCGNMKHETRSEVQHKYRRNYRVVGRECTVPFISTRRDVANMVFHS